MKRGEDGDGQFRRRGSEPDHCGSNDERADLESSGQANTSGNQVVAPVKEHDQADEDASDIKNFGRHGRDSLEVREKVLRRLGDETALTIPENQILRYSNRGNKKGRPRQGRPVLKNHLGCRFAG